MSDFTIRSESVDVEQIMKQIRQRILEKRGADYTEEQIRELATVRLEKFLDPKALRSDLLEQFRKSRPATDQGEPPKIQPPYAFDDQTLFASHRGFMRLMRKLLNPLLKMMFNPNTLNQILHSQAQFNVDLLKREARRKIEFDRSRAEWNALYYEVLHNLVLETTRMGIEVQNLRMKVESLSSRLDFSERRVRALEGVVQYRPEVVRHEPGAQGAPSAQGAPGAPVAQGAPGASSFEGFVPGQGEGSGRRRRRRRRGRRGQGAPGGAAGGFGAPGAEGGNPALGDQGEDQNQFDDGPDEDGSEEMEATGGFDIPEPVDEGPATPEAHQADSAPGDAEERRRDNSDFAPGDPEELRRDKPSDDDVQ